MTKASWFATTAAAALLAPALALAQGGTGSSGAAQPMPGQAAPAQSMPHQAQTTPAPTMPHQAQTTPAPTMPGHAQSTTGQPGHAQSMPGQPLPSQAQMMPGQQPGQAAGGAYHRADTQGRPAIPNSSVEYTEPMQRLFQAAQRLREAVQDMAQQQPSQRRNEAMDEARSALLHTQEAMVNLPPDLRTTGSYREAQQQLSDADRMLRDRSADPAQTRTVVERVFILVPRIPNEATAARSGAGNTATGAPAGSSAGAASSGGGGGGNAGHAPGATQAPPK